MQSQNNSSIPWTRRGGKKRDEETEQKERFPAVYSRVPLQATNKIIKERDADDVSSSSSGHLTQIASVDDLNTYPNDFGIIHMNTEINRTEVEECLNIMNVMYPQRKNYDLFFNNIPSPKEPDIVESSSVERFISTDVLKKIIEFSSVQTHNLDDIEAPQLPPSSSKCHETPTSNERSTSKTTTDMHEITKEIKTEPDSPKEVKPEPVSPKEVNTAPVSPDHSVSSSGDSDATEMKLCVGTNELGSVNRPLKSDVAGHVTFKVSVNWHSPPQNVCKRTETESVDGCETCSFVMCEQTSKNSERSDEMASNMHPMTKNNLCELDGGLVLSAKDSKETKHPTTYLHLLPKNICEHAETEALDDYETRSFVMCERKSKSSERSDDEMASDMHPMTKNNTCEPNDGPVLSARDSKEKNQASTYLHLLPQNNTSVGRVVSDTDIILQDGCKMNRISDEFSKLIASNMAGISSQSDAVAAKDNNAIKRIPVISRFLQYNDTGFTENTDRNSYLGLDISSFDANNTSTCDGSEGMNISFFNTSNNETARKKIKLTVEEYKQKKSSLPARNILISPWQTSLPVGKVSSSVQPAIQFAANQQDQTVTSSSNSQNTQSDYTASCPEELEMSSTKKICQESLDSGLQSFVMTIKKQPSIELISHEKLQENTLLDASATYSCDSEVSSSLNMSQEPPKNSKGKQYPSGADAKSLKPRHHVCRKSGSKSYKKTVQARRGNQTLSSTLQHKEVGKNLIESIDFPCLILRWSVDWLQTQENNLVCPPICNSYRSVKRTYQSVQEYYNTYLPLHLLNMWLRMFDSWKISNVVYDSLFEGSEERQKSVINSCSVIFSAADMSKWPKQEDLLICRSSRPDGSTKNLFGRVISITEHEYCPPESCVFYGRPGVWKKLFLDIVSAESFGVSPPASVQLQSLINIRLAVDQNDALKYMNPVMLPVILNPRIHGSLIEAISMQPFQEASKIKETISCIIHSVLSSKKLATIVHTRSTSDSTLVILNIFSRLSRSNIMLLICTKDEKAFLEIAMHLSNRNRKLVLAIKDEEVPGLPPELRRFVVKNCDFKTLQMSPIVLTLMSAIFFGNLEGELAKQNFICLIHEAQNFTETETVLPLHYNIQHLVLVGRYERNTSMHSILLRYGFDVSLFHRFCFGK